MLEKIKFKSDWRCFKAKETLLFRPGINFLVGDQGVGKSSIVHLLRMAISSGQNENPELKKIATIQAKQARFFLFDFEKDNTRIKHNIGNDPFFQLSSMFNSHGETNLAVLELLKTPKEEPCVFVLDEPDMALSIRSITKMIDVFRKVAHDGHQVIASVHHPYLIEAFPEVLSLEDREWMASPAFIVKQREIRE